MRLLKRLICLAAAFAITACGANAAEYYTEVDKSSQIVTVFRIEDGDLGPIARQMICSTGDDTPEGAYLMPLDQKGTDRGEWYYTINRYVKWPTRILGGFLFHSIPYKSMDESDTDDEAVAALGTPASHGCVRLYTNDAKWVSENLHTADIVDFRESGEDRAQLREQLRMKSYDGSVPYEEFLEEGSQYERPEGVKELLADMAGRNYSVVHITNNEFLNIRAKKDFKSDLAGYVPVGAVVEGVKTEKKWTRIRYRIFEGWVSTSYLIPLDKALAKQNGGK